MATGLTVYLGSTASTTLTTAENLTTGASTESDAASSVGTASGWGELWSQGNTGAWTAGASKPAPSGHGWLYDTTVLEGQTIQASTWTTNITLLCAAIVTADVHVRSYIRSSGGVYTLIAEANTSINITLVATATSITSPAASATAFGTGDKLYVDVVMNITSAGATTTNTVSIGRNVSYYTTPGYNPTATVFSQVGKWQVPA